MLSNSLSRNDTRLQANHPGTGTPLPAESVPGQHQATGTFGTPDDGLPATASGTAWVPSMPRAESLFMAASATLIAAGVVAAAWSVGHGHPSSIPPSGPLPHPPANTSDGGLHDSSLAAVAVMVALGALGLL